MYECRRTTKGRALRWRCKACLKDFSITSGTLFAFHKMPLRSYLMAVAIFCNEVKGKSMMALSSEVRQRLKAYSEEVAFHMVSVGHDRIATASRRLAQTGVSAPAVRLNYGLSDGSASPWVPGEICCGIVQG